MNIFTIAIATILSINTPQREVVQEKYENGQLRYEFTLIDGKINGAYTSYYSNGQVKARGAMNNNLRTGLWAVWDEDGQLRVQRNYTDPWNYEILKELDAEGNEIESTDVKSTSLHRDENGVIELAELKTDDVVMAKRLWRRIDVEDNEGSPLFDADRGILNTLQSRVLHGKINVYAASDDELGMKIEWKDIPEVDAKNLVGWEIKEDWFFNSRTKNGEYRQVAIAPIFQDENGEEQRAYWLYYPEVRSMLTTEVSTDMEGVKVLEDLVYYRQFSSYLIKESNVKDKYIADYIESFDEQIRASHNITHIVMEHEHDLWIK